MLGQQQLQRLVEDSFRAEVNAFKPGNVSIYSPGHGMQLEDFLLSAELTSPILVDSKLAFGERIYQSVKITMDQVGCNTNLGMLLLFAPLIAAAQQNRLDMDTLAGTLISVVKDLDESDTRAVFAAINYANPGGLGNSEEYDVTQKNADEQALSLYAAMQFASRWDKVAEQYASGYNDIINIGVPAIKYFVQCWNSVEYALVACYMKFLSAFPDSHIQRKFGIETATEIKKNGQSIAAEFLKLEEPEDYMEDLHNFDRKLKKKNINPGTSADLTACSYLLYQLQHSTQVFKNAES